jgi:hypothetical protein
MPHPVIDHSILHGEVHASRVRIVSNDEVEEAVADLAVLFPHETVQTTAIGCCHTCLYTDLTPPSLVAERMAEHLREFDHEHEAPRARRAPRGEGLGRKVWL